MPNNIFQIITGVSLKKYGFMSFLFPSSPNFTTGYKFLGKNMDFIKYVYFTMFF